MSYDEYDAMYEESIDRLFQEFYETYGSDIAQEAIAEFQYERLQSYFLAHPRLVEPALQQLAMARNLLGQGYADAALVFAASAVEVGLKQALFKPVVYGMVHSEAAAAIITELSVGHAAIDRFKGLLLDILASYLKIDLPRYISEGATKTLWEEIKDSQNHRNAILHRGEHRSPEEAQVALRSASTVVEKLFPAVAGAFGLHLHGGVELCNKVSCKK